MPETNEGYRNPAVWIRLPVMLLLFVMLAVAGPVLAVLSLAQWIHRLIHDRPHEDMTRFGDTLADWLTRSARYLAGSARRRPFPFEDGDLPRDEPPPARPPAAPTPAESRPPATGARQRNNIGAKTNKTAAGKKKKKAAKKKRGKKRAAKKATTKSATKKSPARKRPGTEHDTKRGDHDETTENS